MSKVLASKAKELPMAAYTLPGLAATPLARCEDRPAYEVAAGLSLPVAAHAPAHPDRRQ